MDGEAICQEIGSPKVLNIALLGAALEALGISAEQMETVIRASVRPQVVEMNLKALHAGMNAARKEQ